MEIINKLTKSPVITIDLQNYYPKGNRVKFDISVFLFEGLFLKEKDFREQLKNHDWVQYKNSFVNVYCSTDAIVPVWAYMLITSYLTPFCKKIIKGSEQDLETAIFQEILSNLEVSKFENKKVIIKGCGQLPIPEDAYIQITKKLHSVVKSIMYGELCSAVPVYKKQKI